MRTTALLFAAMLAGCASPGEGYPSTKMGPLRVCPDNPRYFATAPGRRSS